MITDTAKIVASTLAAIQANEAEKARIAMEILRAEDDGVKHSDVAKKYGISTRRANQIAKEYLEEAQHILDETAIHGMGPMERSRELVKSTIVDIGVPSLPPKPERKSPAEDPMPQKASVELYDEVNGDERLFVERMMKAGRTRAYTQKELSKVVSYLSESAEIA